MRWWRRASSLPVKRHPCREAVLLKANFGKRECKKPNQKSYRSVSHNTRSLELVAQACSHLGHLLLCTALFQPARRRENSNCAILSTCNQSIPECNPSQTGRTKDQRPDLHPRPAIIQEHLLPPAPQPSTINTQLSGPSTLNAQPSTIYSTPDTVRFNGKPHARLTYLWFYPPGPSGPAPPPCPCKESASPSTLLGSLSFGRCWPIPPVPR